jgi:hypothetical protein
LGARRLPADRQAARVHARSAIAGLGSDDALLTIRPTAVRICLPDADEHHVVGTVTDVAFRDRGHEHAIDLPGQTMISSVFSEGRVGRGETVGLHFEPSGCMIFPRNGAPAA